MKNINSTLNIYSPSSKNICRALVAFSLSLTVLGTVSCSHKEKNSDSTSSSDGSASTSSGGDSGAASSEAAGSSSSTKATGGTAGANEPSNCKFTESSPHSDPAQLVREFVDRERKGQLKEPSTNKWYGDASMCPAAEASPQKFGVITTYRFKQVSATPETVEFEISYDVAGGIIWDKEKNRWKWEFNRQPVDKRTIIAHKMPSGWRLDSLLMKNGSYLTPRSVKAIGQENLDKYLEKYAPTKPK